MDINKTDFIIDEEKGIISKGYSKSDYNLESFKNMTDEELEKKGFARGICSSCCKETIIYDDCNMCRYCFNKMIFKTLKDCI